MSSSNGKWSGYGLPAQTTSTTSDDGRTKIALIDILVPANTNRNVFSVHFRWNCLAFPSSVAAIRCIPGTACEILDEEMFPGEPLDQRLPILVAGLTGIPGLRYAIVTAKRINIATNAGADLAFVIYHVADTLATYFGGGDQIRLQLLQTLADDDAPLPVDWPTSDD